MSISFRVFGTFAFVVSAFWACVPDLGALSSNFHPGAGGSAPAAGGSSGTGNKPGTGGIGGTSGGSSGTGGASGNDVGGAPEAGSGNIGQSGDGSGGSVVQQSDCSNGVVDAHETDVDCGGSTDCARCTVNQKCAHNSDCASGFCKGGLVCKTPTCSDGYKNQGETGVDCGGPCSASDLTCDDGVACGKDDDCTSEYCDSGTCTDHCTSKRREADETDVDCGGKDCAPCAADKKCEKPDDCESKLCNNLTCVAPSCSDNITNQDESDTDCGGACAPPKYCAINAHCNSNADCESYVCNASNLCDVDITIPDGDVIATFEDGLLVVPNINGRVGNWYFYGDGSGSTPNWGVTNISNQRGPLSKKALHVAGSGYKVWGSGVGADLNNSGGGQSDKKPYDASFDNSGTPTPYAGITFWARSDGGPLGLTVALPDGDTDASGGICTPPNGCDHHWVTSVSVGPDWKRYTVEFSTLTLEAGDVPAPTSFDPTRLVSVQFRTGQSATFDFWIDDIAFVRQ